MLKSKNLALSPLLSEDSSLLFEWINDREQVLHNSSFKPVSDIQHQEWFRTIQQRKDLVIFGIRSLKNNKLIGSCQLHSINHTHRNAELQIRIGDVSERGQGYGTEAVQLLLSFAFKDLNLHRVYLQVFSSNKSAIRVYEKSGFVAEGMLRQNAFIDGQYRDVALMGILKNEFQPDHSLNESESIEKMWV